MNQVLSQKREKFHVEIRRREAETTLQMQRLRVFASNLTYESRLSLATTVGIPETIPSNREETKLAAEWLQTLPSPLAITSEEEFLEWCVQFTSFRPPSIDNRLKPTIESILQSHYKRVINNENTKTSTIIEHSLMALMNFSIIQTNPEALQIQTRHILIQLLLIFNEPKVYKIAQFAVQRRLAEFTPSEIQEIIERTLHTFDKTSSEDALNVGLRTLNRIIDTLQVNIPIPCKETLLSLLLNPDVQFEAVYFCAFLNDQNVDKDILKCIFKIFFNTTDQDLLSTCLDYFSNLCFTITMETVFASHLLLMKKAQMLLATPVFYSAWNFFCVLLHTGSQEVLKAMISQSILQDMKDHFMNLTERKYQYQLLEGLLYQERVPLFNDINFKRILEQMQMDDPDNCELVQQILSWWD